MGYAEFAGDSLIRPLVTLYSDFVFVLPSIILALIVVVVGYIVGWAFGFITHKVMDQFQIDRELKRAGLAHSIGFLSISGLIGGLVKWYVFSLFLVSAAGILNVAVFSTLLARFANWLPNLFAAVVVMLVGLILADFAADRLLHTKRKGVRVASSTVRWFVIVFVTLIALEQIGIRVELATNIILILVAGFAFGIALAVGIGFGNAVKPEANHFVKKLKKNF